MQPLFPPASRPAPVRVVVADDNPVVRAGLTALLSGREGITVVAEAADGRDAYEAAVRHRPDVVLLDVRMPGVDGLTALPYLARITRVVMLTYSHEAEVVQAALRGGAGGYLVHGEFTAEELASAVRDITRGRAHLTPTAATVVMAHLYPDATAHGETDSPPPFSDTSTNPLSQMQPLVGQSIREREREQQPGTRSRLSAREAEIMDLIASGMNNQQIAATCFISEKTVKNHINRIFAKLHSASRSEATATWLGTAPGAAHRGVG
ncbi:response regulator transcription factor [Streptomyces sp. ID05-04B]|uniref:response regulator transcription factor n=1 Tax=Streptomyces sp. ID05-04B TaxID=3028661 RepID=UPI0029C25448|nr:response regulator transcription factor [Streptomyces sp. ID05-04B]MDX5570820.1 response regulator transcription factor [Streptomyces sp. ID05-04B]